MTSTSPRQSAVPTVPIVGGYRLLSQIGEGGMGVVHLAQGPDGNRAALKVLRPNVVGDDESRRRLAQEVDSLQHVRSRHVAEILDADPWGEVPYVVTRFVPGHSLHDLVEHSGPLPYDDLVHAARGLLLAVQDVHAVQVLHRDIKPTNVVMEGRSPILIDFGLARLAEDPRLTSTGWLMGTPGYLAPEVLFGSPATAATDVHGWAATVVYAATGRSPYGRGHVMTVLDRTRRGEIDLTGVPERLQPLLAAALRPEPHERPTVSEAVHELEALAAGNTTTRAPAPGAAPATRPYTVVAPVQRPSPGGATAYLPPTLAPSQRLSGWARVRRTLVLLGVAAVVVASFGMAPYVTAALLTVAALLCRGASHSRQATWQRRSLRGRKWFDGPLAGVSYPWHVVRGSLGALALLLTAGALTAAAVGAALLTGARAAESLLVGGVVLALATWVGPGSARLREPVRRTATGISRHPAIWWLTMASLVVLAGAASWAGSQAGITWDPASGPPTDGLRDLADLAGLEGVRR